MDSYGLVVQAVKRYLKRHKISQAKLAEALQVPESTLKKWLNAKDGSFNRLHRVCDSLGISLSDLLRSLEKRETQTFRFTDAQQEYFSSHPNSFEIYWLLVYERWSVEDVQRTLALEATTLRKHLLRFDRLRLLEVQSDDRLKLPKLRPVRWSPEGEFITRVFRDWSMQLLSEGLSGKADLILQHYQLNEDSAADFKRDLKRLEERYARRTVQEMASGLKTTKVRFLSCSARGSFVREARKPTLF